MARTRTQTFAGQIGSRTVFPANLTVTDAAWTQVSAICTDTLGPQVDHALTINKFQYAFDPLDGSAGDGLGNTYVYNKKYAELRAQIRNYSGSNGHLTLPAAPSLSSLATTVLSRTNPSRADVSIPNFVYELKDLPGMYHDIMALKLNLRRFLFQPGTRAEFRAAYAANQYLAGVFGWRPLISDLRKMMEFQSRVDKRVKELRHLYSSGGMKRTLRSGLDSATASFGARNVNAVTASQATIRVNLSVLTKRECWATVRWTPTHVPRDLTDAKLQKEAFRLVYGLNIQPRYLWDAIPWSWLVDWFANIGDYVSSYSNVVPAVSSVPCIMRKTTTEALLSRGSDSASGVRGGNGSFLMETKERFLQGAVLSASLPFLSDRQMSILGALAVQRISR